MEEEFSSSYLCLVVFRGAMEPLFSSELMNFSNNLTKQSSRDCKLLGLVRKSRMVVHEWMVEPMMGEEETDFGTFPCTNIGEENIGLIQAVRVPLIAGSPSQILHPMLFPPQNTKVGKQTKAPHPHHHHHRQTEQGQVLRLLQ